MPSNPLGCDIFSSDTFTNDTSVFDTSGSDTFRSYPFFSQRTLDDTSKLLEDEQKFASNIPLSIFITTGIQIARSLLHKPMARVVQTGDGEKVANEEETSADNRNQDGEDGEDDELTELSDDEETTKHGYSNHMSDPSYGESDAREDEADLEEELVVNDATQSKVANLDTFATVAREVQKHDEYAKLNANNFDLFWKIAEAKYEGFEAKEVVRNNPTHKHSFVYVIEKQTVPKNDDVWKYTKTRNAVIGILNKNKAQFASAFEEFTLKWTEHKKNVSKNRGKALQSWKRKRASESHWLHKPQHSQNGAKATSRSTSPRNTVSSSSSDVSKQTQETAITGSQSLLQIYQDRLKAIQSESLEMAERRMTDITKEIDGKRRELEKLVEDKSILQKELDELKRSFGINP